VKNNSNTNELVKSVSNNNRESASKVSNNNNNNINNKLVTAPAKKPGFGEFSTRISQAHRRQREKQYSFFSNPGTSCYFSVGMLFWLMQIPELPTVPADCESKRSCVIRALRDLERTIVGDLQPSHGETRRICKSLRDVFLNEDQKRSDRERMIAYEQEVTANARLPPQQRRKLEKTYPQYTVDGLFGSFDGVRSNICSILQFNDNPRFFSSYRRRIFRDGYEELELMRNTLYTPFLVVDYCVCGNVKCLHQVMHHVMMRNVVLQPAAVLSLNYDRAAFNLNNANEQHVRMRFQRANLQLHFPLEFTLRRTIKAEGNDSFVTEFSYRAYSVTIGTGRHFTIWLQHGDVMDRFNTREGGFAVPPSPLQHWMKFDDLKAGAEFGDDNAMQQDPWNRVDYLLVEKRGDDVSDNLPGIDFAHQIEWTTVRSLCNSCVERNASAETMPTSTTTSEMMQQGLTGRRTRV
jgi:hypothetical protein